MRVLVLVALAVGVFPRPGLAADARERLAVEAFAAGRYEEALGVYAKLYAETLHPVYLRNIGRCHQKLRDPDRAIDAFREYLRKAGNLPAAERAEIDGFIREMEDLKSERARAAAPPPAAPQMAPPPPSPAAPPVLVAPAPAPPPPTKARWLIWSGVAAVVAGGVVAAIVILGRRDEGCGPGVDVCAPLSL